MLSRWLSLLLTFTISICCSKCHRTQTYTNTVSSKRGQLLSREGVSERWQILDTHAPPECKGRAKMSVRFRLPLIHECTFIRWKILESTQTHCCTDWLLSLDVTYTYCTLMLMLLLSHHICTIFHAQAHTDKPNTLLINTIPCYRLQ